MDSGGKIPQAFLNHYKYTVKIQKAPSSPEPAGPDPSLDNSAGNLRINRVLNGKILPMLARLAAPNVAVVTTMTLVTIADAWFVGQIGVTALASLALVYPVQALMQMMSAGAMGGGISSAVARAMGSGRSDKAEAIVVHALLIGLLMAGVFLTIGGLLARPLFSLLGGREEVLAGAIAYGQIAFGGGVMVWLANTLASVLRGTSNLSVPAKVIIGTSLLQGFLSGMFTLGWGGAPALGVRGPALALVLSFGMAAVLMAGYLIAGRGAIRFRLSGIALRTEIFMDILKVGGVACGNALLTIATVLVVTRLVAARGAVPLAGYGLGSRLELILVPIAFGIGGALTVAVGTNFGARQFARARRIAWTGGLVVTAVTGAVGIAAALHPGLWLGNFTNDGGAFEFGSRYLTIAGPFYGFFGLGMALYFASQGTGTMAWPFGAGVVRLVVAAGGGACALLVFESRIEVLFAFVAAGFVAFGGIIVLSLLSKAWHPEKI